MIRLFWFALLMASLAAAADDSTALLRQVKAGGVILYMRHAMTDLQQRDASPAGPYEDCTWQRNLTEEGRAQARIAGDGIARLGVSVERVLASPMCRTMETARIAFRHAEAQKDLLVVRTPAGGIDTALVRRLLQVKPTPGKVTVMVGHELPGMGFEPMKEADTIVIRPRDGGYDVEGRLTPQEWQRWMP